MFRKLARQLEEAGAQHEFHVGVQPIYKGGISHREHKSACA